VTCQIGRGGWLTSAGAIGSASGALADWQWDLLTDRDRDRDTAAPGRATQSEFQVAVDSGH
jgi:hypothetical protein